ncbi:MAG: hypothetical protein ABEJ36_05335 [Candidatus Nanosalina sp.]
MNFELRPLHLLSILVFISLAFSGFTAYQMTQLQEEVASIQASQVSTSSKPVSLPTGTPEVYGEELGVKYQDVSRENRQRAEEVIQKFSGYETIQLSQSNKHRYVEILYEINGGISCEYCCEARSVITKEGESGCGCAHAAAMRGLTKYLLKNHGEEMTDRRIFTEISKWKTRFFPQQTKAKAAGLKEKSVEVTYVNLASNEYRGVSSDKGGWVGDC